QINVLDELDYTGISLDKKQQTRENLDKMVDNHYYIMSSSANNKTMLHLIQKQTCELKIKLFGGFDEEEMKEWWSKHNPDLPAMDKQQIEQIEDITGKIPLFLKFLLESDHKNFTDALEHLNQKLNSIIQLPMIEFSDNLLLEKGCLASICRNGITANKINFKVDGHQFFSTLGDINFSWQEGFCTFYLLRKWNQKSIDGLLVLYRTGTLYIAPVQITFDKKNHSDSEGAFFSEIWPELKSGINNLNVEIIFIWITQKNEADVEVARKVIRRTRVSKYKKEVEINPDYTSV
ncbi:826_t:CDS:2, partial [Funneliformis geosporum]